MFTVHFFLSKLVKVDELKLDEDESKQLGAALARIQKEFGIGFINPKVAAIGNLAMVAGGIYVPRIIAMAANAKKKRPTGTGANGAAVHAATIMDMPAPSGMM